jgi:hypothetical protein
VKMEHMVTAVSLVGAIAGGIYFAEDRYAHSTELDEQEAVFQERVQYANNYHLEKEIERAQDKLEGLLLIPDNERRQWQDKEIIRLENLIDRLIRQKG